MLINLIESLFETPAFGMEVFNCEWSAAAGADRWSFHLHEVLMNNVNVSYPKSDNEDLLLNIFKVYFLGNLKEVFECGCFNFT